MPSSGGGRLAGHGGTGDIFISAGDASGDGYGADLSRALRRASPDVRVSGVGGGQMSEAGVEVLAETVRHSTIGFTEVLRVAGAFRRVLRRVVIPRLRESRPLVVLIDSYAFNIHVGRAARALGLPVAYYVSPQVWASRPWRIRRLARVVDRMLVILPFEEQLYRDAGVPVQFVGHPLLDRLPEPLPAGDFRNPVIGLLPGSRRAEVARLLPVMFQASRIIRARVPGTRFVLPLAPGLAESEVSRHVDGTVRLVRDGDYQARRGMTAAITASGTATLENALLGIPMVVCYRLSTVSYWIIRSLIRVKHISLANLLAGGPVVPELIQGEVTPERLAAPVLGWLEDPAKCAAVRSALLKIRADLGEPGAAERAASAVLAMAPLSPRRAGVGQAA